MGNKLLEITKSDKGYKCLLCCKNVTTLKMKINRLVDGDNVTSFHICDECLAQMQREIETCE